MMKPSSMDEWSMNVAGLATVVTIEGMSMTLYHVAKVAQADHLKLT